MSEWSVCLQSRQGRKIVKLSSATSTQDLYKLASDTFDHQPIKALKYGFPPNKQLTKSSSDSIEGVIQNQERLQVEFEVAAAISVQQTSAGNKKRTSKRAAAKAATQAMPAVIQAQEEIIKQQTSSPKKRPRTATKKKAPAKPKFSASVGTGRRLTDGAAAAPPPSSRRKKNILQAAGGNSDMSEALLGALNDRGKMGQVLRKGMKNAVTKSYETSRAFSRLAAIQVCSYEMTESNQGLLSIKYKGTVDKTIQEETVDKIPRDVLDAVIRGIHASNQEALRAENLALLSPRVLWSLVHIFPNHRDIKESLQELLPDLDWTFLRRRAQQLSEKALENLRQEQRADGEADMEKAQDAISVVEHAMEHLQDHERSERAERQARAALARLSQTTEEWALVTPTELDRDELSNCIQVATPTSPTTAEKCIDILINQCNIHNWRELANVMDTMDENTNERVPLIAKHFVDIVALETIVLWIDKAQEESVDEIMVQICDDTVEAVELLTHHARTGTPKDLANWRLLPEVLHSLLPSSSNISILQLTAWCQRAHELLQEYEWLDWYATPVE